MTSDREVALLRLVAQGLAVPEAASPVDAVRRLGAVQAQDLPGAVTSVALRTTARRRRDVEVAMDDGEIVRTWPMRGTLHLLAAVDLRWMLELLAARTLTPMTARWADLGLDQPQAERARELVTAALAGGRMRRADLLTAIDDGGVSTAGQRGYHLLGYLARTGTLCLGPTDGTGEQLYVLVDDWVPVAHRPAREEALGELALRFFLGHGPATEHDLARWAGLPLRDVRTGLSLARSRLATLDVGGVEHHLDPEVPDRLAACRREAADVVLLPGFDEFVLGYRDRSTILAPEFAELIVPGGNGMFRPTVVLDGRVVGTWAWTGRGAQRVVSATPFTSFPAPVTARIEAPRRGCPDHAHGVGVASF